MTRDEAIEILASWDPDGSDLSDDVARWIATDEGVQAAFDARFEHAGDLAPVEVPEGTMARVLGGVVARPQRRPGFSWTTLGLLAAAGLSVVVLGALPMGALMLVSGSSGYYVLQSPKGGPVSYEAGRMVDTGSPAPGVARKSPPPAKPASRDLERETRSGPTPAGTLTIIRGGANTEARTKGSGSSDEWRKNAGDERGDRYAQGLTADKDGKYKGEHRLVVVQSSKIEVRDSVAFLPGSSEIRPESDAIIEQVAQVLLENPDLGGLSVDGHTDTSGSAAFNKHLSEDRARAVQGRLLELGVPRERLQAVGFGETRPIDSNQTAEGRYRNGRVEFSFQNFERPQPVPVEPPSTERYTDYGHRDFTRVAVDPLSTFSVDVDTASYTLVRRKLREGYLPPTGAVRVEEFVNYFPYDYRPPSSDPFAVHFEATPSPFNPRTHLVRVGVQGKKVAFDQRKSVHLTFLVDTSGSMSSSDKLGLVQSSLKTLTSELEDGDTVSIAAYAGSAGLVLAPTPMSEKADILRAIDRLRSGGSTAMGQGIQLAYAQAERSFHEGAVNRVIICSDGDANVGPTSHQELSTFVREHARNGVTLTTLGFGSGNYNDTTMEQLANDGDGNYYYVDSEKEAKRIFVDKLTGTLQVIAKDVKIQVDWTDQVEAYRLIGYENRDLADHQFRDDRVDAGEIGAGHQVTALYEVALVPGASGELATVRIRNKAPGPDAPASERAYELSAGAVRSSLGEGSRPYRISVAAAYFAEMLRRSPHTHEASFADVAAIARGAQRAEYAEDGELIELMEIAARLTR